MLVTVNCAFACVTKIGVTGNRIRAAVHLCPLVHACFANGVLPLTAAVPCHSTWLCTPVPRVATTATNRTGLVSQRQGRGVYVMACWQQPGMARVRMPSSLWQPGAILPWTWCC